jgi:restriction endonuclease S subunit
VKEVVRQVTDKVKVEPDKEYPMIGVRWYGEGTFLRETVKGDSLSAAYVTPIVPNAFIYNRLFAWKESFAVVPDEHRGSFVSNEFPQFIVDEHRLLPRYLYLFFMCSNTIRAVDAASIGSAAVSRNRFKEGDFLNFEIPLPPLPIQRAIVEKWEKAQREIAAANLRIEQLESSIPSLIYKELAVPNPAIHSSVPKYMALLWKDLERWSFNYLARSKQGLLGFTNSRYPIEPLGQHLVDTMNGYCIKPVSSSTPHKMLKLSALTPAGLDLRESKFINVSDRIVERFSLRKGDLLICRSVGSYEHVAKCALVEKDEPNILFPDIMIRVRFNKTLLPEYAREVIQTPLGRSYFQSSARTAVGMWKIGAEDIRNFPMPRPPLEIQSKIVQDVWEQREKIWLEREKARHLAATVKREVEEMILGTRPVPEVNGKVRMSA